MKINEVKKENAKCTILRVNKASLINANSVKKLTENVLINFMEHVEKQKLVEKPKILEELEKPLQYTFSNGKLTESPGLQIQNVISLSDATEQTNSNIPIEIWDSD